MRVPSSYHEVAFDAVAQLPYPADKPNRSRWSATRLAEIARYEGAAHQRALPRASVRPHHQKWQKKSASAASRANEICLGHPQANVFSLRRASGRER